jgi:hypothetical protein
MSASNRPPPVPDENPSPELSAEEEAELRRDFAEGDEEYRRGECIPMEHVLKGARGAGTGAEPVVLEPELEAELERRSAEVRELDRQGALTSADEHLRKLRARREQRRAG